MADELAPDKTTRNTLKERFIAAVLGSTEPRTLQDLRQQVGGGQMNTMRGYASDMLRLGLAAQDDEGRIFPLYGRTGHAAGPAPAAVESPAHKERTKMAETTMTAEQLEADVKAAEQALAQKRAQYEQAMAAQKHPNPPAEPARHGLCQDTGCSSCGEARAAVRRQALHEAGHAYELAAKWAGIEHLLGPVNGAVQRWVKAGRPAEGYESVADQLVRGGA